MMKILTPKKTHDELPLAEQKHVWLSAWAAAASGPEVSPDSACYRADRCLADYTGRFLGKEDKAPGEVTYE